MALQFTMAFTSETIIDDRTPMALTHSLGRFQILLEGVTVATRIRGHAVYIATDPKRPDYGRIAWELKRRGAVVIDEPPGKGMMGARFAPILAACDGHDVVTRVEDGKLEQFCSDENYPVVVAAATAIMEGRVDLVTFHRRQMLGYPDLQRQTEMDASAAIARMTGLTEYDSHSGPIMGSREAMRWLTNYDGKEFGDKWQSTCVLPPVRALVEGLRVGIMKMPNFHYPFVQFRAENGDPMMEEKRRIQAQIPQDIAKYVKAMKAEGKWPPKQDFILLN